MSESLTVHVRGGTVHRDVDDHGTRTDVWSDGPVLAEGPPGQAATAALTIDAAGCAVVPLMVDSAITAVGDRGRGWTLTPGNPATFAVVRGSVSAHERSRMLVVSPARMVAVMVHGHLVARDGEPMRHHAPAAAEANDPRLGDWHDRDRDMIQHLTIGGRYAETRQGRENAYTGRFWLTEDRITYLDDQGFWAFGQYVDGVLHHAGFVLERP